MNMEPMDQERELDQWLDSALARRGAVEPRLGLERRVLARLAAESQPAQSNWLRGGGLGLATAASLTLLIWFGWLQLGPVAPMSKVFSPPANGLTFVPSVNASRVQARHPRDLARRQNVKSGSGTVQLSTPARLLTFPSPAPLNEQEKLLARYVREFPDKAQPMARAQTELRKQDEREMALQWPNIATNNSEQ